MVSPELLLLYVISADLTQTQLDTFLDRVLLERTNEQIAKEYGVTDSAVGASSVKAQRKISAVMAVAA